MRHSQHHRGKKIKLHSARLFASSRPISLEKLEKFDLQLAPEGTSFQLEVWRRLCEIPYGATVSYGELANRIGNPKACRAVGLANGSNPIPIVIPCHRVIGSNGNLTGYGGGLPIKEKLLRIGTTSVAPVVKWRTDVPPGEDARPPKLCLIIALGYHRTHCGIQHIL